MEKCFNKELVMTKEDNKDFKSSARCCNSEYDNEQVDANRYRNINVEPLNQKIPFVFYSLKNYKSYLIMQELSKINFEINVLPNRFKKYMRFNINTKFNFIDSFQFLSSSADSFVKNLG